jgi:hypothetical protein
VTPYYEDADVTLYLGDCREVTAWLEADVLVTDPPYGVGWSSGAMSRAKAPRVESISGDDDTTARDAALALWGSRPAIVFGSWRQPRPPGVAHRLIWHKRGAPAFSRAPWYPVEEEIYVIGEGWVGEPAQNVISTQEWRSAAGGFVARVGHPTPKPGSLMEPLIAKCPPGIVADPFAGSGSTLLAARAQNRRSIGVEVEERYCELVARRLAQGDLFGGAA